jgi:8-oxo-dGTP pyrophosphatase MutT (NUDIX family)
MNILAIFYIGDNEPIDYIERPTVKAVIVNENDEVLFFSGGLPGGGVEKGETNEEALKRELMEEIGANVKIVRELGNVISYRDLLKAKYIFTGYQCSLVSLSTPTTTLSNEIGGGIVWKNRADAIAEMQQHIVDVNLNKEEYEGDRYQRHILNTEAAIVFLKEVSSVK